MVHDAHRTVDLALVDMLVMHLRGLLGQEFRPEHGLGNPGLGTIGLCPSAMNRHAIRIVALEMRSIDFNFFDFYRMGKRNNAPVKAGIATPASLPAISHVDATPRKQNARRRAIVGIAPRHHTTAQ